MHDRDDVVVRDHLRQTEIEALGWVVVRFSNAVALGEPWRIDEAIRDWARVVGVLGPPSHSRLPLPAGGGKGLSGLSNRPLI